MDVVQFVGYRGGAVKVRDLAAAGFTRHQLSTAVREGSLVRPLRGVYAIQGADDDVVAAFRANGLLTCRSAARYYSLWSLGRTSPASPASLHLSCGNGLARPGIVDHAPCTHPKHPQLPVAGLADVLLHALRCLPEPEALVMLQCAVGRGLITTDFLRRKLPGHRNGRARAVLDLVVPRADSLLEVLAHTHFVRAGFRVRMHVQLDGVGEVDFLIDDCLVVELDGGTHFEPRQVRKDQRRNNATILGGRLVLRFYYSDVVNSPEAMVQEIREVLRLRALGGFAPEGTTDWWLPAS
jgi:very-short-patch-repair endonuclease